jgi:hypothetical protein
MNHDSKEFQTYPAVMYKEQLYKVFHISKRTALYLLHNGLAPNKNTTKRLCCCNIIKSDITVFMKGPKKNPNKYILGIRCDSLPAC